MLSNDEADVAGYSAASKPGPPICWTVCSLNGAPSVWNANGLREAQRAIAFRGSIANLPYGVTLRLGISFCCYLVSERYGSGNVFRFYVGISAETGYTPPGGSAIS